MADGLDLHLRSHGVGVASPKAPDHQSNTGPQNLKIKCSDDFLQLLLVVD